MTFAVEMVNRLIVLLLVVLQGTASLYWVPRRTLLQVHTVVGMPRDL